MKPLDELQYQFCQSIIYPKGNDQDFISSVNSLERLNIYRQTIKENLRNSLEITFPGIWSLLGKECADSVAYNFLRSEANWPTTGCLDDWGNKFPQYLASLNELSDLPYLSDYAQYEWIEHQAYGTKLDYQVLDPNDLLKIPEKSMEVVKLILRSSILLYESNFPIDQIKEVITNSSAPSIYLIKKPTYAIIARLFDGVLTFWINKSLWYFIRCLKQKLNLRDALKKVTQLDAEFDLSTAIHFLLNNKLIKKVILS